jgi:hypothetical protein
MNQIFREQFDSVFGTRLVEVERPVSPPDEPILNIDVAEKRLTKSLTAQKASEYWDDFSLLFKDEVSDEELDQMLVAIAENDQPELMLIMQKIHKRAIRTTAQLFLGQLGGGV